MKLRFSKMHGLGNDFMVVDLITQGFDLSGNRIRQWSDRGTGVGFDQLLAVLPPTDPNADFRYRIFNADGSEAEQCGNGARCFARFVYENQLTPKRNLTLETSAGLVHTRLLDDGAHVQVNMGAPVLDPERIPFHAKFAQACAGGMRYGMRLDEADILVTPVSMGNPHAIVFVKDIVNAPVAKVGAAAQASPAFPEGVNVGFLQVVHRDFARLRVFERGVGETQACGSGACAAMVAGQLRGCLGSPATISLIGGELQLQWAGPDGAVSMSGPTAHIYEGRIRA